MTLWKYVNNYWTECGRYWKCIGLHTNFTGILSSFYHCSQDHHHVLFFILLKWKAKSATYFQVTWWPYQMEIFSALLALCEGNSPVTETLVIWNAIALIMTSLWYDAFLYFFMVSMCRCRSCFSFFTDKLCNSAFHLIHGITLYLSHLIFNPRPLRPKGCCRHLRLSLCPSVCVSIPITLVNTITQSVYPINPPNLQGGFDIALSWMVL